MSGRVAAFFDLDGTLMPLPSLEQRFFRILRYRGEIPLKNYFLWLREAMRLLPRGTSAAMHANKMYLKGVQSFDDRDKENRSDSTGHKSGHPSRLVGSHDEGQASTPPKGNPRWPVPHFFEAGVERVAWHVRQGHPIVIMTGTLDPLAKAAARALEVELAARGLAATIRVCATTLEEIEGRWTGRILGKAMCGEAKAQAVKKVAVKMRLDLSQCWAYGDSAKDRWMLSAVGNPTAMNPPPTLARIARKRGWPVLRTAHCARKIHQPQRHAERCA